MCGLDTQPSSLPSAKPSVQPSYQPSTQPSMNPTQQPSGEPSSQPSGVPSSNTPSHTVSDPLISVPLYDLTSCMRTANISGNLVAEVIDVIISSDRNVIVKGRFQASNVANVLNIHLLKIRWFVGRSSYRQRLFLNRTEITYPSNPNDMIRFQATFPNFFPASADFSGYLKTKVILTNWQLRKKALCLRWRRKAEK